MELLIIAVIIAAFIAIIVVKAKNIDFSNITIESGSRQAGRRGETAAINAIKNILRVSLYI